ncbi:MAG TPA: substrate-binding domain-containing protein, partial [Acidimicrobiales bacterium]|nr:substrate-binding domain-containing protein [Acidimicrobiales bacterium]
PKTIGSLADLARPGVILVLCAPEVPCGRFGAQVLSRAGVDVRPRSLEPDVKGVVSKVSLGEADAGIVYVTDTRSAAALEEVAIPPERNVIARYAIVPVRGGERLPLAEAFIELVRSPSGRAVLDEAGFQAP